METVAAHLQIFYRLRKAYCDWAAGGFPQTWPLIDFGDEPTRFLPARMIEADPDKGVRNLAILINAFPQYARGAEFFQLRVTLNPPPAPDIPLCSLKFEIVDADNGPATLIGHCCTPCRPGDPVPRATDWLLESLRGMSETTNRQALPVLPTLRLTGAAEIRVASIPVRPPGHGLQEIADPLHFFGRTHAAMRRWARAGFPQAWPLIEIGDEPARIIPVRFIEPVPDEADSGPAILMHGFPVSTCGSTYFQLLTTLLPELMLQQELIDEHGTRISLGINGALAKPDTPTPDIADWLLQYLMGLSSTTARRRAPTRPTLIPLRGSP